MTSNMDLWVNVDFNPFGKKWMSPFFLNESISIFAYKPAEATNNKNAVIV